VKDITKAMIALIEEPAAVGQVFNLGNDEETTIKALAEKIIGITGSSSQIVYVSYEKAYEEGFEDMQRRVPDTSKAQALIGFRPTLHLDGILKLVVEDVRSRLSKEGEVLYR